MTDQKRREVVLRAEVIITVTLPIGREHDAMCCDDPAVECAITAIPQHSFLYLWGESSEPAEVWMECNEMDVEIEEDNDNG